MNLRVALPTHRYVLRVHRPAALHSLGCSAEEISAALERKRKAEDEASAMKKIEDKTTKAELERREKDAKNPPKPEGSGSASGSNPKSGSKPKASSESKSESKSDKSDKPDSEGGSD